ncbi:MAG: hypothetical protein KKH75_04535, partial [Actinobacteria bacterium]|nr:hypothetical protein [Actinomycetota bacterium]
GERGTLLPPLTDHHVHLHLIDERPLATHGIAAVLDLGGFPDDLARRGPDRVPHARYAGAFLTAPGGYPSGRTWAPPATVREVEPGADAAAAVAAQAGRGASVIKVCLNASGPIFDHATLAAVVEAAHRRGLPVVAHAEGVGMTDLAIDAGIDALAHTPFSERLSPETIARAIASGQRWISTLAIHRGKNLATASAQLAAFVRAGGQVLYGTDLGNGDLPVGVNAREIVGLQRSGLHGDALLATLTDPWPAQEPINDVVTFVPGDAPVSSGEIPEWLASARVVSAEEVLRDGA